MMHSSWYKHRSKRLRTKRMLLKGGQRPNQGGVGGRSKSSGWGVLDRVAENVAQTMKQPEIMTGWIEKLCFFGWEK